MLRPIVLALALAAAGEAAACPADAPQAGAVHLGARQLATPRAAAVRAGGPVVLALCPEVPGAGHVPFEPQLLLDYRADLRGRGLEIAVEAACAPVLLVRTARGNWHFGDARLGTTRLVLGNPRSGRYQVWVGTREPFGCDARLSLRTVRPARS